MKSERRIVIDALREAARHRRARAEEYVRRGYLRTQHTVSRLLQDAAVLDAEAEVVVAELHDHAAPVQVVERLMMHDLAVVQTRSGRQVVMHGGELHARAVAR